MTALVRLALVMLVLVAGLALVNGAGADKGGPAPERPARWSRNRRRRRCHCATRPLGSPV